MAGTDQRMRAQEPGEVEAHPEMMAMQLQQQLWTQWVVVSLGAWLVAGPWTLGYRDSALAWSDVVSGLLVIVCGFRGMSASGGLARWGTTVVAIWLLFAPLAFWAPTAAAYANDTLVGLLLVGMAILVPGMPGMRMLEGPEIPPGWSYCPSTFAQRAPAIALAFVSLLAARHLAAFQLRHVDAVFDPFFGSGTEEVLTSNVSRAFPVSDAGLGVFSYALEMLSGYMGVRHRWRTMPWMVLMFGFLVIPLGLVSITLVVLQPVMVGTWCTLCLFTAAAMLLMIPYSVDEVVAMGQFMAAVRRERKPFWRNLFGGGSVAGGGPDERTPQFPAELTGSVRSATSGVTWPWNLSLAVLLGLWLMAAPTVLGLTSLSADVLHVLGPVIVTVTVVATAEPVRAVRYLDLPLGLAVALVPWLTGVPVPQAVLVTLTGVAVAGLSLRRGQVRQTYGSWDRFIH
jgi:hypothetical protein